MMEAKVGEVAYKLNLPVRSKIHPIFHVSQLKKHIGKAYHSPALPLVGTDRAINKELLRILDRRMVKKGNLAVTEVLVEWINTFPEDPTWESWQELQQQYPRFDP